MNTETMWKHSMWLVAAVACCGCGMSGPGYTMLAVEGIVTLGGEPLANAELMFDSVDGPRGFGISDEQGAFAVITRQYGPGLPAGTYDVFISGNERTRVPGSGRAVEIDGAYQELGFDKVTITPDATRLSFDLEEMPSENDGGGSPDAGGGA